MQDDPSRVKPAKVLDFISKYFKSEFSLNSLWGWDKSGQLIFRDLKELN